jgi:hypothetical protein
VGTRRKSPSIPLFSKGEALHVHGCLCQPQFAAPPHFPLFMADEFSWFPRSCVGTHIGAWFSYGLHSHARAWERVISPGHLGNCSCIALDRLGSYRLHERQGWRECRDCTTARMQELGQRRERLSRSKSLPMPSSFLKEGA